MSLFGNNAGGSLFGNNAATQNQSSLGAGGAFGGGVFGGGQVGQQNSLFGNPQNNPATSGFGGANVSAGFGASSTFGGAQQNQPGQFGNTNTNVGFGFGAQQNQQNSLFGGANTGGGLFGNANQNKMGGSIFGGQNNSTQGAAGVPFGGQMANQGGFGNQTTTQGFGATTGFTQGTTGNPGMFGQGGGLGGQGSQSCNQTKFFQAQSDQNVSSMQIPFEFKRISLDDGKGNTTPFKFRNILADDGTELPVKLSTCSVQMIRIMDLARQRGQNAEAPEWKAQQEWQQRITQYSLLNQISMGQANTQSNQWNKQSPAPGTFSNFQPQSTNLFNPTGQANDNTLKTPSFRNGQNNTLEQSSTGFGLNQSQIGANVGFGNLNQPNGTQKLGLGSTGFGLNNMWNNSQANQNNSTTNSLFTQNNQNDNKGAGTSLFQNNNQTQSLFSNNANQTQQTNTNTGSIFGNNSNNQLNLNNQPKTGGLFSNTSTSQTTNSLFAPQTQNNQVANNNSGGQGLGLFNNTNTLNKTGSIFGPSTNNQPNSLFSNQNNGSLFNQNTGQNQNSGGLFNNLNQNNQNQFTSNLNTQTQPGLFNNNQSQVGGLFNNNQTQVQGLFNNMNQTNNQMNQLQFNMNGNANQVANPQEQATQQYVEHLMQFQKFGAKDPLGLRGGILDQDTQIQSFDEEIQDMKRQAAQYERETKGKLSIKTDYMSNGDIQQTIDYNGQQINTFMNLMNYHDPQMDYEENARYLKKQEMKQTCIFNRPSNHSSSLRNYIKAIAYLNQFTQSSNVQTFRYNHQIKIVSII